MNKNIKMAKNLVKLAKQLIAITMTRKDFNEYSNQYEQQFGQKPDEKLFDIFHSKKDTLTFLKQKKRTFPNLKQFLSKSEIQKLLNNKMFCIVSAGRNSNETPITLPDAALKKRYDELKRKLQSLNVPYYQVYGLYFGSHQVSYIVDLTNDGKNSKSEIDSLLHEIRRFCLNEMKQDCIIQGIGKETVFQYNGNYRSQTGINDPFDNEGRSSIFSKPPHKIRHNNHNDEQSIKDISQSFSNNYDFDNDPTQGQKY